MTSQMFSVKASAPVSTLNSLYDVVVSNLKNLNQKTFLTRIVYAVKSDMRADDLINELASSIHSLNELGPLGLVTGVQLVRGQHSIVMIEGAESTLLKHLGVFLDLEKICESKMKAKILVSVDHITQRFFNRWDYIQVPVLAGAHTSAKQEDISETDRIKECVFQFFTFCEYLQQNTLGTLKTTTMDKLAQQVPDLIPTPSTLDFVLDSEIPVTISNIIRSYRQIPQTLLWRDNVWPLTSELVPEFILRGDGFAKS